MILFSKKSQFCQHHVTQSLRLKLWHCKFAWIFCQKKTKNF